jgi:hypothetical protein
MLYDDPVTVGFSNQGEMLAILLLGAFIVSSNSTLLDITVKYNLNTFRIARMPPQGNSQVKHRWHYDRHLVWLHLVSLAKQPTELFW